MTYGATSLDLTALVSAVARLREGLERHRQVPQDEQLRDGLIQRFRLRWGFPISAEATYLLQQLQQRVR